MALGGTRGTNTFDEGLRKLFNDVTALKLTDDPDVNFIYQLETMILEKIKEPQQMLAQTQAAQGGGAGGGMPGGGMPPGGDMGAGLPPQLAALLQGAGGMGGPPGGGMPPGMPQGGPPAVPGLRNAGPAPDELARLMSQ